MKCGIDIFHIPRMEKALQDETAIMKLFTPSELVDPRPEHLAGVFAAKEAFFKAINEKPSWLDIEVIYEKNARPKMKLSARYSKAVKNLDISISHDKDYAIAFVVLETY